jgi:P27 family predicted phage terminase small subunit
LRGRKPIPNELAAIHGNPRHIGRKAYSSRRAVEPDPPSRGELDAPDDLSEPQRAIWDHAVANMTPGILRTIDTQALLAWVLACDLHRQARIQQNRTTLLVNASPGNPNSMPVQSPLLAIINRQALIMLRAATEMGFTPVSRPRLAMGADSLPATPGPAVGKRAAAGARCDRVRLEDYIANAPDGLPN